MNLPPVIPDVAALEELLSRPTATAIAAMQALEGDLILLGAGGKMGPSLARLAQRATVAGGKKRQVIAVSRFTSGSLAAELERDGIVPVRCDLLDPAAVARLPEAGNVIYMPALKFGASGNAAAAWATNTFLPSLICQKYRQSRIVAFSTGNVYGLVRREWLGSREEDPLNPVGEYAMSALGRERMFEYFSRQGGTRVSIIRLNYACEMRYGVLVDLARRVLSRESVPLETGYFNIIWQRDANAYVLQSFAEVSNPPSVWNITGPEILRVREVAENFGRLLNQPVVFSGAEADTALLSNPAKALARFGAPEVPADQLIDWIADWLLRGQPVWGKPTRFETRDGRY